MIRDKEIILDIIRACNLVEEFCNNLDFATFQKDLKTQSSVLYQIVIIGEAVNRLSTDFAHSNSQIPINAIRGMRNRIVHEYKDDDYQTPYLYQFSKVTRDLVNKQKSLLILFLPNSVPLLVDSPPWRG